MQFGALLRRLKGSPTLTARFRRGASGNVVQLQKTVLQLSTEVGALDRKREQAWELHAAGKVRADDVQPRLDRLATERAEIESRLTDVPGRLALAESGAKHNADADDYLRRAPELFRKGNEEQQRQIARAVAVQLGGLYVDANGKLKPGVSPTALPFQRKARPQDPPR